MPQFGAIGVSLPNRNSPTITPSTAVGNVQILPSPSIWGSCDGSSLKDNPDGFFIDKTFKEDPTLPGLPSQNGTYTYDAATDSAVNVAYTSTGNATVFVKPMLPIAVNGGTKLWFEISLNVKQTTNDMIFVGLATSTGLSSTLLASSTTLLNTAGLIGFWLHGDAPTQFDAIYQKPSGTPVTVLASVLTAAANNSDPGNPFFVPSTPPGVLTGTQGYLKLGVKTDKVFAYWFVNGTLVAKQAIDSTFDTTDSFGAVASFGTQTNATDNAVVSFLRTAARLS